MKLNFKTKFFYGGGDFSINIMWQLTAFFLLLFYTDVFGISPATAGLVIFIAKFWDAATDPIMGYIADNTSTRWGKFRPYLLFASLPALAAIILTFTAPNLSETGKFYWALCTYISFTTLYTIVAIPYGSLIPAMTQNINERTELASFRYMGGSMGSIAVVGLTPFIAYKLFESPIVGFPIAVGVLSIFAAIFFFLCFLYTKEKYSKVYDERISIKRNFNMLTSNFPLQFVIAAVLGVWMANNIKQVSVFYFVKYNLQLEPYFSLILIGVIIQIMMGAFLANLIKGKLEKKNIYILGTVLYIIADLIIYFITGYENFWILALAGFPSFIGFGIAGVAVWSMLADTIEYGEWKSGFRAEGVINSFYVCIFKLSLGLSGLLVGTILEKTNYVPNAETQSIEVLDGLFLMGYLFPVVAGSISILIIFYHKYDSKFYKKIVSELSPN